jgi:hypothetical protein
MRIEKTDGTTNEYLKAKMVTAAKQITRAHAVARISARVW